MAGCQNTDKTRSPINHCCVRFLEPVAAEVVRIGGSGARREMMEDMLFVALMRSGEAVKARELLDCRLHRRPSPRDTRRHGLLTA